MYPNPTENQVTLTINALEKGKVNIKILNSLGQIVKSSENYLVFGDNELKINVTDLSSGVYLIDVNGVIGTWKNKLIIEK